jgi:hypothetical protein
MMTPCRLQLRPVIRSLLVAAILPLRHPAVTLEQFGAGGCGLLHLLRELVVGMYWYLEPLMMTDG